MKISLWLIAVAAAPLLMAAPPSGNVPQVITPPETEMAIPADGGGMQQPAAEANTAPGAPRLSYNGCNVDGPYIAMTFDDGPKPGQTDRLLDMLKERGIKVTFFVIGQNAAAAPELIKRMVDEGHEVANHSWNHPSLTKLSAAAVAEQINKTDEAIVAGGAPRPTLMRPPYGATNASLNRRFNEEFGHKVILWTVDPLDWKIRNSEHVQSEILANTKPGAIILSHDIHPTTVSAMPATLDALLAKGYKFVTVSQLIAMDRPAPTPAPSTSAASPAPSKKQKH